MRQYSRQRAGLLTLCWKRLRRDQEIAPELSFRHVIAPIGQTHPGLAMQCNAPTVYFDNVIHGPPLQHSFEEKPHDHLYSDGEKLQSVIEGRGGTIKLYPWAQKAGGWLVVGLGAVETNQHRLAMRRARASAFAPD